jgi:hypothetical protein
MVASVRVRRGQSAAVERDSNFDHYGVSRNMKKTICTAIAVVFVTVFAAPALAGNSSSSSTYSHTSTKVQKAVAAKHTKPAKKPAATLATSKPTKSGTLPFTGVDLSFIVAAGLVLVVLGVSLRRLSRPTA